MNYDPKPYSINWYTNKQQGTTTVVAIGELQAVNLVWEWMRQLLGCQDRGQVSIIINTESHF